MKKGIRILALVLAILMLLGTLVSSFASAEGQWDKSIYAYGAGLNEEQVKKTAELLNIEDMNKVNITSVSAEDLYRFLKMTSNDKSMISSIFASKKEAGSGLKVVITTPENITKVTGAEYTNAALTAGVTDAEIYVGAYKPVTGTSALTGVFKAFEYNGEKLDEARINVANEELETVNAIVQEHKEKEGFNIVNINNVIINVKEALIQFKESNGKIADQKELEKIVGDAIKKHKLDTVINQTNINNLVVYFQNFQNSPAIDSKELKSQLKTFQEDLKTKADDFIKGASEGLSKGVENLKEGAKGAVDKAKEKLNSEEAKGFFAKVAEFFKNLFQSIIDFFKSL